MKWMPSSFLDYAINQVQANTNGLSLCSSAPTTYFNAARGVEWVPSTLFAAGDVCYPITLNGYVYECLVGGTSGTIEPPYGTSQDSEFFDNTITWKTHVSYLMGHIAVVPANIAISSETFGKRLTIASLSGLVVYGGTLTHTALVDSVNNALLYVTESATEKVEDDIMVSGHTFISNPLLIDRNDVA